MRIHNNDIVTNLRAADDSSEDVQQAVVIDTPAMSMYEMTQEMIALRTKVDDHENGIRSLMNSQSSIEIPVISTYEMLQVDHTSSNDVFDLPSLDYCDNNTIAFEGTRDNVSDNNIEICTNTVICENVII